MRCDEHDAVNRTCWLTKGHETGCDFMPPGWETFGACIEGHEGVMWGIFAAEGSEPKPLAMFDTQELAERFLAKFADDEETPTRWDMCLVRCWTTLTMQNGPMESSTLWHVTDTRTYVPGTTTVTFQLSGGARTEFAEWNPTTKTFLLLPYGLDEATAREALAAFETARRPR